uniref:Lipocalin n=1 Tax=Rhipicephalus appendiculatus TaxID=34631 RepID=A0A131YQU4_RHIAP
MQKNRIPTAYACIFFILPLLSDGRHSSPVVPDMTKFLNTSEPIWLYMTTTAMRGYDCNVYVIDKLEGEYVNFRRFLGYRKVIISDWMQFLDGYLNHSTTAQLKKKPYDVMDVKYHAPTMNFRLGGGLEGIRLRRIVLVTKLYYWQGEIKM